MWPIGTSLLRQWCIACVENRETDQPIRKIAVQTLDEMLDRKLLTADQHGQIRAWVAQARTPDAIRRMPAPLWRTLELASVLMDVDADLIQPPLLTDGS